MNDDQFRFLTALGHPPARLNAEQTAWVLNCHPQDIPILVACRLLKPLGTPLPSSVKYYATVEIVEHARDRVWLAKVTNALGNHWRRKNQNKRNRLVAIPELRPPANIGLS